MTLAIDITRLELYLCIGALLLAIGLAHTRFRCVPLTTSMVYLLFGYAMGCGFDALHLNLTQHAPAIELVTELMLLISLLTAGLKLRLPFSDPRWKVALRLALLSMVVSVGLCAWLVHWMAGFSMGAAVLTGAILAPTDPVLASETQVQDTCDEDPVRFSLTAEAGFNDGTALPMVLLGLGWMGFHDLGAMNWKWWTLDILWGGLGGFAFGTLVGTLVGRLVAYLRHRFGSEMGAEELLALAVMAIVYGASLALHVHGFLAVFAAGLALRRLERRAPDEHNDKHMAAGALHFNEWLELLAEAVAVLGLGVLLATRKLHWEWLGYAACLFFLIRPLSTLIGLWGAHLPRGQRKMLGWFGIRGIGSLYYLSYALTHGLSGPIGEQITDLVLFTVTLSIVVHGVTGTPLLSGNSRPAQQESAPDPGSDQNPAPEPEPEPEPETAPVIRPAPATPRAPSNPDGKQGRSDFPPIEG